jgi:myo-inositol 2-dehydrogenase/D-chiro-inositol 1-dehydrogenase
VAHLPSLARIPGTQVVAVADTDAKHLAAARRLAPEARAIVSYMDVLSMPDVDAVVIALPPALHAPAAIAALERGKHVYVEKPLATNVADGRRVLDAWEGTGLVATMGFNYRRNPLVQRARDALVAGVVGAPIAVHTVFSTAARQEPAWKTAPETGGGVLLDLAVHHIDLLRFLLDAEVAEVAAELQSIRFENDTAFVRFTLTSGCVVQSFFSLSAVEEDRIEIRGSKAKLVIDRYRSLRVDVSPAEGGGALSLATKRLALEWLALPYALRKLRAPLHEPSFPIALAAFGAAVRDRIGVRPDLTDGLRALTVIEAIEASARAGQVVSLGVDAAQSRRESPVHVAPA